MSLPSLLIPLELGCSDPCRISKEIKKPFENRIGGDKIKNHFVMREK